MKDTGIFFRIGEGDILKMNPNPKTTDGTATGSKNIILVAA
jgi:hypothetical protein